MDFCLLFFLLSQQPPPLSTFAISSTVFKQIAISYHNFSTNKEEAEANADAYAEARSRFVIFWEPSDLCPVLKTGQFDRSSKGSLKI